MSLQLSNDERKAKTSFWSKIFRSSKKSSKQNDESFRRQSFLHSSFHCTKASQMEQSQEDEVNFTTLESSELMEMHKDAGIIFVNKNHVHNLLAREEEKRVQFVPTPMNKYYKVNTKAAPSKKSKKDENKENLDQSKKLMPARPILRLGKSKENLVPQKLIFPDDQSNTETNKMKLVNVSYFEGPEIKKTPLFQRTSTKLALFDRNNGSLPHLNVSGISRYGSLPRTAKINKEIYLEKGMNPQDGTNEHIQRDLQSQTFVKVPIYQGTAEHLQSRPQWYSSQHLPHFTERKPYFRQLREHSKQIASHRLSLGEPIKFPRPQQEKRNSVAVHEFQPRYASSVCEQAKTQREFETNFNDARTLSKNNQVRSSNHFNMNQNALRNRGNGDGNSNVKECSEKKIDLFPNKAINEVGLPFSSKMDVRYFETKQRSRSQSPHYIPLSETYSSNIPFKQNVSRSNRNIPQATNKIFDTCIQTDSTKNQYQSTSQKNVSNTKSSGTMQKCPVSYQKINQNYNVNGIVNDSEHFRFISQTKKQAIVTRMYNQKRMLVNKMCKYKSKECDEGFSSMADDECSFNCSCSSCLSRFSKGNGKFSSCNSNNLKDDRYFFILTDNFESKEEKKLETVLESPSPKNKIKCSTEDIKHIDGCMSNKTWYDCNDSLCKTPKNDTLKLLELRNNPTEINDKLQDTKTVENIYENITKIINSATKQNFDSGEIRRMFSTPLSKTAKANISRTKISRALFSSDNKPSVIPIDEKQNNIVSPFNSPLLFNDSIILLQEIFQKLSQECKELLQPNISSNQTTESDKNNTSENSSPGDKYVNELVKRLQAKDISEGNFANIIGNIAQNIFLEAKAKRSASPLPKSSSLPDITKSDQISSKFVQPTSSLLNISIVSTNNEPQEDISAESSEKIEVKRSRTSSCSQSGLSSTDTNLAERDLPEGWSRSPTSVNEQSSNTSETTSKDNSGTSESDLQLLENAIRLGMGLSPIKKEQNTPHYSLSPAKAVKYKSKDVLSCKGKLKLKIYHNSGLVTIHVIRAAKLSQLRSKESFNSYVKISMVPDDSKRVNWRTSVQKSQKNPVYNQIFSFEVLMDDLSKRLVFSVWHRDFEKLRSELIGCMSFSVGHVLDESHKINGWYRLLREGFGTEKHFAAHTRSNACPLKSKPNKNKKRCVELH